MTQLALEIPIKSATGVVVSNMIERSKLQIAVIASICAISLTGCGSEGTTINYSGPYDEEVTACGSIASGGVLRSDDGVPSRIWIDKVEAEQKIVSPDHLLVTYEVSGETHATDASGEQVYAWDCHLSYDFDSRVLTATLGSFEHVVKGQ